LWRALDARSGAAIIPVADEIRGAEGRGRGVGGTEGVAPKISEMGIDSISVGAILLWLMTESELIIERAR
jgi:hypothetical protein